MRLTDMGIDGKMRITDLADVSDLVRRRLSDMGIVEGVSVSLKKKLPFRGPCTIESNGMWVAIRHIEAIRIGVEALC